jgi:hypothetical protein
VLFERRIKRVIDSDKMAAYLNTYADRAKNHTNPAAKALLETIERKQSNLCVSVDVTSSKDFLSIIDTVGPYVSLIKASPSQRLCCPVNEKENLTIFKPDPYRYH